MSKTTDGGPAFPSPLRSEMVGDILFIPDKGMSLRDYFAAAALTGILGSRTGFLVDVGTDNAPVWAYQTADRMLAERSKEPT